MCGDSFERIPRLQIYTKHTYFPHSELKEENSALTAKLSEAARAKVAAEASAQAAAAEAAAARDEARLAARRAAALQQAIAGDLSSPGDSRDTDR